MPSFVEIGSLVPEKIFEGVLPYMGMAAILFCLFSSYSHQSISDYSWEVYIVHSGVFAG